MSLLINNALLMGTHYNYPSEALYTFAEANSKIINDGYIPVANADELNNLRNTVSQEMGLRTPWQGTYTTGIDKKYIQVKNLDNLNSVLISKIGDETNPFSGTFDGNNLSSEELNITNCLWDTNGTLINIKHKFKGRSYVSIAYSGASIINCDVEMNYNGAQNSAGFILLVLSEALIDNCIARGDINNTNFAGGFVIQNQGVISNCKTYVNINSTREIGGFVYKIENNSTYGDMDGSFTNCQAYGDIESSSGNIGGFVGQINVGVIDITNCQANGNVTNTNTTNEYAYTGGFVGSIISGVTGTISGCLVTGNVLNGIAPCGGFCGYLDADNLTIENCQANGDIESSSASIGGFVGKIDVGVVDITNCQANGNVTNTNTTQGDTINAGGFIGFIDTRVTGTISKCIATGNVSGVGSAYGGFCGNLDTDNLVIEKCIATGNVTGYNYIGAFLGITRKSTQIVDCYSAGSVNGNQYVGGFCGWNRASCSITNCYSIGEVTGNINVGGFCGLNDSTITNSYWNTITSEQSTSNGGTGKTTTEMQESSIPDTTIYVNWDNTIWNENTTSEYPTLK